MKKKVNKKVQETIDAYKRDKGDNIITDSFGYVYRQALQGWRTTCTGCGRSLRLDFCFARRDVE